MRISISASHFWSLRFENKKSVSQNHSIAKRQAAAIIMSTRSQSISTETIISLVAAVAINSAALWWQYRSQQRLENGKDGDGKKPDDCKEPESDLLGKQKKETKPKDKKKNIYKVNSRNGTATVVPTVKVKVATKKQRSGTMDDDQSVGSIRSASTNRSTTRLYGKQGTKVSRPIVRANSPVRRMKRTSPKRAPRVRDSLLPTRLKKNSSPKKINYFDQDDSTTRSRKVAAPRVRDSLLPWNVSSKNQQTSTTDSSFPIPLYRPEEDDCDSLEYSGSESPSVSKPKRAPKVRQSLLPWNNHKPSTAAGAPKEESDDESFSFDLNDFSPETKDNANKPMPRVRDSLLPWNCTTTSLEPTEAELGSPLPHPRDENVKSISLTPFDGFQRNNISKMEDSESPLPIAAACDNNITSRSPLMDSTNRKKERRSISKDFSKRIKSPTLARLSLGGDNDVKSLCKVFEEWEGPAQSF